MSFLPAYRTDGKAPAASREKDTDNWGTRSQFPVPKTACASVKRVSAFPLRAGNMAQQTASSTIHQPPRAFVLHQDAEGDGGAEFFTGRTERPTTADRWHTMSHGHFPEPAPNLGNILILPSPGRGGRPVICSSLGRAPSRPGRCALRGAAYRSAHRTARQQDRSGFRRFGAAPACRAARVRLRTGVELAHLPRAGGGATVQGPAAAMAKRSPWS